MKKDDQVFYNGRWTPKSLFRTFVYNSTGQKLASTYNEYENMISSGLWFDTPELAKQASKTKRKLSNDFNG